MYAALAILVSVLVFVFYVARRHYESPPKAIPMLPKQSLLIRSFGDLNLKSLSIVDARAEWRTNPSQEHLCELICVQPDANPQQCLRAERNVLPAMPALPRRQNLSFVHLPQFPENA